MEIKLVLFLPRDAASVPVIRQVLDGCLDVLGVAEDTRTDIALALSEACANVIQHAGPGEEYEVAARVTGSRCIIEVVNTGTSPETARPAAPEAPPGAENGRGLKIINAVVDDREEVVITRAGHEPVVIVSLEDYQSLKEAAYLLRSPENARRLLATSLRPAPRSRLSRDPDRRP